MKKAIITLLIIIISLSAYTQNTTTIQRYGGGAEISGVGGGTFAIAGTIEYKYTLAKSGYSPANIAGGNLMIGATISDGYHILIGGGYDQNLSYERGQPYATARINTPVVVISGKLLFSQQKNYKNNFEVAAILFPGQNVVGIGGFYLTDYDCTVIGAKLTFRFGKTNGSSHKKRDDCTICGL